MCALATRNVPLTSDEEIVVNSAGSRSVSSLAWSKKVSLRSHGNNDIVNSYHIHMYKINYLRLLLF